MAISKILLKTDYRSRRKIRCPWAHHQGDGRSCHRQGIGRELGSEKISPFEPFDITAIFRGVPPEPP